MGKSSKEDLREEVNERFFKRKQSKRHIIRELGVSWNFVIAWTKSPDQDFSIDKRGWPEGKSRFHPTDVRDRIVAIRQELVDDPNEFYVGDLAIQQRYEELYPNDPIPGVDYINKILREANLSNPHKKKRRGVAKYLCYPAMCIERLGERIADIDFVGQKYLSGHSKPLHFLSVAYRKPPRLRSITRTEGETTAEAIEVTERTFNELGWPDVGRIDNGFPFAGGSGYAGRAVRYISRYAAYLISNEVIPVFGAPRHSWHQSTGEGTNSVFGRNFWDQQKFKTMAEVDERLAAFNRCSKKYAKWKPWIREKKGASFIPRVCFIRKVEEDAQGKNGQISITGQSIILPVAHTGLFVFTEWHLREGLLKIYFEREAEIQQIEAIKFPINPRSRKRCSHFII